MFQIAGETEMIGFDWVLVRKEPFFFLVNRYSGKELVFKDKEQGPTV